MNLFENLQLMKESEEYSGKEVYVKYDDNNKTFIIYEDKTNKEVLRVLKNAASKEGSLNDFINSIGLTLVNDNLDTGLIPNTEYQVELYCAWLDLNEQFEAFEECKKFNSYVKFHIGDDYFGFNGSVSYYNNDFEKLLKTLSTCYGKLEPYESGLDESTVNIWKEKYTKNNSLEKFNELLKKYIGYGYEEIIDQINEDY